MKKIGLISSAFLLTLALQHAAAEKVQKIRIVVPVLRKVPHSSTKASATKESSKQSSNKI